MFLMVGIACSHFFHYPKLAGRSRNPIIASTRIVVAEPHSASIWQLILKAVGEL